MNFSQTKTSFVFYFGITSHGTYLIYLFMLNTNKFQYLHIVKALEKNVPYMFIHDGFEGFGLVKHVVV